MLISAVGTRGEDGVVNLVNEHGANHTLKVIGASFPVLAARGVPYTTITVIPPLSHLGVIAVAVETSTKTKPWTFYLLSAEWLADPTRPWVNVEHAFRPNRRRLGQIDTDGVIEVQVECEVYATAIKNNGRVAQLAGRISADDACAYMAGILSADQIRERSQAFEQQQTELEMLREQLKHSVPETVQFGLEGEIALLQEAKQGLEGNVKFWRGVAFAQWEVLRKFRWLFGTVFGSDARILCDSPRFKTARAHQLSWQYPGDAFHRKDGEDWV